MIGGESIYPAACLSPWSGSCDSRSRKCRRCSSFGRQPGRGWRAVLQHQERSLSWSLQPTWEWAPSDRWGRNCSLEPWKWWKRLSDCFVFFVLSRQRTAGAAASSTETGRHRQTTSGMESSTSQKSESLTFCSRISRVPKRGQTFFFLLLAALLLNPTELEDCCTKNKLRKKRH